MWTGLAPVFHSYVMRPKLDDLMNIECIHYVKELDNYYYHFIN